MSELALPFESRYYPIKKFFDIYQHSIEETEAFWEEEARQLEDLDVMIAALIAAAEGSNLHLEPAILIFQPNMKF